jgi:hypothetical protein
MPRCKAAVTSSVTLPKLAISQAARRPGQHGGVDGRSPSAPQISALLTASISSVRSIGLSFR